jgi:S-adenosylmethionine decarboxylase proenzyme
MMNDPLGQHLFLDCYGCRAAALVDLAELHALLKRAAAHFGLTVIAEEFHQYAPQGVSGVLLLAESHLAVHTWPEKEFAAVDLFTCGVCPEAGRLADLLKAGLGAERVECRRIERGTLVTTAA